VFKITASSSTIKISAAATALTLKANQSYDSKTTVSQSINATSSAHSTCLLLSTVFLNHHLAHRYNA
jgi:hypothetical protein